MVPAGTTPCEPFTGVTLKAIPLQVVAVIAFIVASGFTVTVKANVAPVQFPDTGVTR